LTSNAVADQQSAAAITIMEEFMTLHVRSNLPDVQQPLPPGFGEGKPWRLRIMEWYSRNPKNPNADPVHMTAMLFNGMPVHEELRAAYWEARDNSAKALEAYRKAGVAPPYRYFLFDAGDALVGCGSFDANDCADDMAWISCMFLEMGSRTCFVMSIEESDEVAGASIDASERQTDRSDDRRDNAG
jgi:hypothetical protein